MKQIAWVIVVVGLLLAVSTFPAEAGGGRGGGFHGGGGGSHRGGAGWHGGTRVFIGGGFGWWGWPGWWGPGWWGPSYPYYSYYPSYPYYAAPPVAVQQAPTQYIQQDPSPPSAPQYWYYCQNPQGYYPYVKDCSVGWMQVVPQPPPPGK